MENIKQRRRSKKVGKDLSLARPKRGRPSVLLAKGRPRLPVYSPNGGDKRKETTTINKEAKRGKTKDTTAEGKAGAEATILHGTATKYSEREGYSKHNKAGQPDTRTEGENSKSWRSAKELGIEWIDDFCPDGKPHYLIDSHHLYEGAIFRCANCHKSVWLPFAYVEAVQLENLIGLMGVQDGYCKYLDKHRPAKVLVAKLQDLWRAKQQQPNNGEFLARVLEIMGDKDYDRRKE